MKGIDKIGKLLRFFLALFLWAHAVFAVNIPPNALAPISTWLHLSASEAILVCLLLLFTFVTGSSFWRGVANVAYIYFFPFVLLFYVGAGVTLGLVRVTRRLKPATASRSLTVNAAQPQQTGSDLQAATSGPPNCAAPRTAAAATLAMLGTPFRRFSLLWGFLLLVATHKPILWLALAVLLLHIGSAVLFIARSAMKSGTVLEKIAEGIRKATEDLLEKLRLVTPDTVPTNDLKNVWTSFRAYEVGVRALKDERLLSRWALLFYAAVIGTFHLYLALLFSFAYCGIARISEVP